MLLSLALPGLACQTRLVGQKTFDYDPPDCQPIGVPFRMSAPAYVIEKVLADDGTIKGYDLSIEYHSDPHAVYWVNIDPAMFDQMQVEIAVDLQPLLPISVVLPWVLPVTFY